MRCIQSTRGGRRGAALLPVLFAVMALAGMGAALVSTSLYRQSEAQALHERTRAYSTAMSGLDLAIFELQEGVDLGLDGIGNVTGTLDTHAYAVRVAPAYAGRGEYVLTSSSRVGPAVQGVEVIVTTERKFPFGMFADIEVSVAGSYSIDSYDATLGTYTSQLSGGHALENADIGSNGDIHADGGPIYGNATPGPGSQVLGDLSNVTGSTGSASKPLEFEPYVYAPTIASTGDINTTTTLLGGAYRYDSIDLSGGHELRIVGDVELFIDGDIEIGGTAGIVVAPGSTVVIRHGTGDIDVQGTGIVNSDQLPSSITVTSATTGNVSFGGTADYYGLVYATEAQFDVNGAADLYGVIIAEEIDVQGSGMMHYDESLLIPNEEGRFFVISAYQVPAQGV